jgi:hypothetical protein
MQHNTFDGYERGWRTDSKAASARSSASGESAQVLLGGLDLLVAEAVHHGLEVGAAGQPVARAKPDVVVHQMTALSGGANLRDFDKWFATTNQLRTTGTKHLLAAAEATGVGRFVAQSYTGWSNVRVGGPIKTEDDPYDPDPAKRQVTSINGLKFLDRAVPSAAREGLVLRYGNFYGPGASDELIDLVKKRKMPIIGSGAGVVVVDSPRRRRIRHGRRPRPRHPWHLQHRRRRSGTRLPLASVPGRGRRREGTDAGTHLDRPAGRRRGDRAVDDPSPRSLQHQGQAGAGLAAHLDQLAGRVPRRAHRLPGPAMTTVLVTGATGNIGSEVPGARTVSAAPCMTC